VTPERRRDFEDQWPAIQSGLKGLLARKKVPFTEHDDLIQETALRLYGMWARVDPSRSPWPLAVTIALNLVRDGSRRRPIREVAAAVVPDVPDSHEVERAGLARIELGRVRDALHEMSPAYRSALLVEVGDAQARATAGSAAQKMTRVRARRKLVQLVEKVSALLPFRYLRFWRWTSEAGQWLLGARDGVLASIPCIACLAVGVTTVIATNVVTPAATAHALPRHGEVSVGSLGGGRDGFASAPRLLRSEVRKGATSAATSVHRKVVAGHKATTDGSEATSPDGGTPPLPAPPEGLPDGGGDDLPVEAPVPGGGGGDNSVTATVRRTVQEVTAVVTLPRI
jgi:DNA-directed RNA polymerase specialized sigma24 family protein